MIGIDRMLAGGVRGVCAFGQGWSLVGADLFDIGTCGSNDFLCAHPAADHRLDVPGAHRGLGLDCGAVLADSGVQSFVESQSILQPVFVVQQQMCAVGVDSVQDQFTHALSSFIASPCIVSRSAPRVGQICARVAKCPPRTASGPSATVSAQSATARGLSVHEPISGQNGERN